MKNVHLRIKEDYIIIIMRTVCKESLMLSGIFRFEPTVKILPLLVVSRHFVYSS